MLSLHIIYNSALALLIFPKLLNYSYVRLHHREAHFYLFMYSFIQEAAMK